MRLLIGLRTRVWLLMLVVLLPALVYITVTSLQERSRARAQAQTDLLALARLAGSAQKQSLEEMQRTLALASSLSPVRDAAQGGSRDACAIRLAEVAAQYPQSIGFGLWNLSGDAICANKPLAVPASAAGQLWMRQVLARRAFAMGDYQASGTQDQPTITFGYPVTGSNGELLGVVSSGLDLGQLTHISSTLPLPVDAVLTVFDHNGVVLARSVDSAAWIGKSMPDTAVLEKAVAAGAAIMDGKAADTVQRLYAFTPILGPGGSLGFLSIGRPEAAIYGPPDAALARSLAIAGGLAVVALALAGFWSRQTLVRPMQALVSVTDRLAQGDLSARAWAEPAGSEVDRLALGFNAMAANLERRTAEQHKTEQELLESEERFRVLANTAPDMIWTAAPDGAITYANNRWFDYLGIAPGSDMRGWPELVLHPDDHERCLAVWNQCLREGTEYEIEARHRRHDGIYRWFLTRAVPVRDESGRIATWFGTTTDIHERKLAEERATRLQAVTAALSRATTPSQAVEVMITAGASAIGAVAGSILLLNGNGQYLEMAGNLHIPNTLQAALERIPLEAHFPSAEAARSGEPIWVETAADYRASYPELAYMAATIGFESLAAIPLHYEGRLMGVLVLGFSDGQVFTPGNRAFILALSQQCAQALERARLFDAERKARQAAERATYVSQQAQAHAARLETVTAGLSKALTPGQVTDVILHQGAAALGATAATLMMVSEDGEWLQRSASQGYPEQMGRLFSRYRLTSPIPAADAARTGEAVWIESAAAYRARFPQLTEAINMLDYEAAAAVPLRYAGRVVGVLAISFPDVVAFTSDIQSYILTLAGYCAQALERARLFTETQRLNSDLETRVQERTIQLEYSLEQLRDLAARLQAVREDDRRSLARELHDELGGTLTGLKMAVAKIRRNGQRDDADLDAELAALSATIDSAAQCVRRIATELRPAVLDDLGLLAAIEWLVQDFENRSGIACRLILDVEEIALDPDRATAIFRVLQESLTNVARHAQAAAVVINVTEQQGQLALSVEDDGQGFDHAQASQLRSLGLLGMRERVKAVAGELTIRSAPGQGTTIQIRIPLGQTTLRG